MNEGVKVSKQTVALGWWGSRTRWFDLFDEISRSDEGLTLKTSALKLFTAANLHYQLSWWNQIFFSMSFSQLVSE